MAKSAGGQGGTWSVDARIKGKGIKAPDAKSALSQGQAGGANKGCGHSKNKAGKSKAAG